MTEQLSYQRCGAWPEHGGCILPSGHLRGMADVPGAHQFPRHVTVHLPVTDGTPLWSDPREPQHRTCPACGKPISFGGTFTQNWLDPIAVGDGHADRVVVTHRGTLHAACYPEDLRQQDVRLAWAMVARDIARAPSQHTAAELRAVLRVLAGYVELTVTERG